MMGKAFPYDIGFQDRQNAVFKRKLYAGLRGCRIANNPCSLLPDKYHPDCPLPVWRILPPPQVIVGAVMY